MKNNTPSFKSLLALAGLMMVLMFLPISKSKASHLMGGDLIYKYLFANTYLVTYNVYRDCSGIEIGANDAVLVIRLDTCGTQAFSQTMNYVGIRTGAPYCAQIGSPCSQAGRPNYQVYSFELEVNFNSFPNNVGGVPIPRRYDKWALSVSINARPTTRNLTNANNLYSRALLNNLQYTDDLGIVTSPNNNSPRFNTVDDPVPVVCLGQEYTFSFNTIEEDGDSLAYEFAESMEGCDNPVAYRALDVPVSVNGGSYNALPFTFRNPLPSFTLINIPQLGGGLALPTAFLDNNTGAVTFTPIVYDPNPNSALGRNKYVMAIRIREYRRFGNQVVQVGYIQRDVYVIIQDCGGNLYPGRPNTTVPPQTNSTVTQDTVTRIAAQTCNYTVATIDFRDPNPTDSLSVTFPNGLGLAGTQEGGPVVDTVLTGNNTARPRLKIVIRPDKSMAGKTYNFVVRVSDNGCPITGIQNRQITIKVVDNNLAVALNAVGLDRDTVCRGTPIKITASTKRPDSLELAPAVYKYKWDPAPGLDPSQDTSRTIFVNPPKTTKYKVRVSSSLFTDCEDTASILVRVRDSLSASFDALYLANSNFGPLSTPIEVNFKNTSTPRDEVDSTRWWIYQVEGSGNTTTLIGLDSTSTYERGTWLVENGGKYKIRLKIWTKAFGRYICPSTYEQDLVFQGLMLPNVVTPGSSDDRNDVFVTQGFESVFGMRLYNRWGQLVRDYETYNNDFDAKNLEPGTYFYHLIPKIQGAEVRTGWLEILK